MDTPKLIFYTNFKKDLEIFTKFNLRNFFGNELFNKFLRLYYPELVGEKDKEILKYFKENKKRLIDETEKAGKKLKKSWAQSGKDFFKQVEEITGFKWKHKIYKCHLSFSFICGGCYDAKRGNIVSVFPRIKHASALNTLFHELVHLHYWEILDKLKIKYPQKEKLTAKGKFWDLSEIAVNYPLQKLKIKGYKTEFHIYPQHKVLWKKIKKYWKLDFKNFILKSVEEIQKAPPKN